MNERLEAITDFPSTTVVPRNISIWLPPDYYDEDDTRYRVVYAHDGQNLFDPGSSYLGVDWDLHTALDRLTVQQAVEPAILVGIWNTPYRVQEYDPQRVFEEYMTLEEQDLYGQRVGIPMSDAYLKFLTQELKPYVDTQYRTRPGRESTHLMGSSMGGIVSLYALCEYPDVFQSAACLSTHWPTSGGRMVRYLERSLPTPGKSRIYFDHGTTELDAGYAPYQDAVNDLMDHKGFAHGRDWVCHVFPGEGHSEHAWRQRTHLPLQFLLGRQI